MPKNPMQDIVPNNSRSIRNIPIPQTRIKKIGPKSPREQKIERERPIKEESGETLTSVRAEFESHANLSKKKSHRNQKRKIWITGTALGVVLLAILISTVFHSAIISVVPQSVSADVTGNYTAKKDPAVGNLPFETLTLKQIGTETVKASGEEQVNIRATGVIVIYNNYNATAQRLIKNTRFETPEGLIYRISDSVTVPGKNGTTPGSVEATVTADEPGDKYNVGLRDFTIPGFKGDPRFSTFYARSKTPLDGGFSGVRKIVAEADRTKAESSIRSKLESSLLEEFKSTLSSDVLLFDKAFTIDFVSLPEEALSGSEALIQIEGILSAAVFNKALLSSYLAMKTISGYKGDAVMIKDPESISFIPDSDFRPATDTSISFSLSGNPTIEWVYDEGLLKDSLIKAKRDEVASILNKFPMIERADISIRPFWRGSFPDSINKITVKKVNSIQN